MTPPPTSSPRWLRLSLLAPSLLGLWACGAMAHLPGSPMAAGAADRAAPAPPPAATAMAQEARPPGFLQVAADAPAPAPMAANRKEEPGGQVLEMQWAPVREFPAPNYEAPYDGPRVDFRETVFWKPSLRTNEGGEAQVQFYLSDAVTSFRATVEGLSAGGQPGHGEGVISSKLPVSLSARLPLEVSAGDVIELPITVSNATNRARKATLEGQFGAAFALSGMEARREVQLKAGESQSSFASLKVVGNGRDPKAGDVLLAVNSGSLNDSLARSIKVVPAGFPREETASGKLSKGSASHTLDLPDLVAGTLEASVEVFPSPTATLVAGTEAMLREPSGCFEQASSTNYPNVMVLSYLSKQGKTDAAVATRATQMLGRGYKKLTGYESKGHGFEWFGADPGHEALTAYGVMQFSDMARVFSDVDKGMIKRTVEWLRARRDGKGGFQRNSKALDSFGRASDETTAAYITYAITEAGESKGFEAELGASRKLARSTRDPYLLALAAGALLNLDAKSTDALDAVKRLAALQSKEGHFPGARESITRSGGNALDIETTALAALALLKAGTHPQQVSLAAAWLAKQRNSWGGFSSTQATVLSLKALTRVSEVATDGPTEGTLTVVINGGKPHELKVSQGAEKLSLAGLEGELKKGKNTVEVRGPSGLSYSVTARFRTTKPPSSPKTKVGVSVEGPHAARVGESVKLVATISNTTGEALPMVIARIGLPGGLTFQQWQLDELKTRKIVDFYETREREVIVYFRGMAPKAKIPVDLQLIAAVPGQYTAPASQAYLYYTDEHRSYTAPLAFTVSR